MKSNTLISCWLFGLFEEEEEEEEDDDNLSFTTFKHYIGYSSHYIHTFIVRGSPHQRKKKISKPYRPP